LSYEHTASPRQRADDEKCREHNLNQQGTTMNQHHILTVGISLITNFARDTNRTMDQALRENQQLKEYLRQAPCKVSAEINALHSRTAFLTKKPSNLAVTLVFTCTRRGKTCASLLEQFLKHQGVEVHKLPVRGADAPAQDYTPEFAAQEAATALRELRQRVTAHVARLQSKTPAPTIQFNATGGFKAECAVLYELGRTLRIPVYYLHETFKVAVELP
jgi:putative CRISPR-associated protein (TIGR02619 family)